MATHRVRIVTDGDLVLLCEGTEFEVSSRTLEDASPMFAAMFKPNFMEGHKLHNAVEGALPVMLLPEDSAMSIRALCTAIHHSHTETLDLDIYFVLAFAVTVDKYQCAQSIADTTSKLLENLNPEDEPSDVTAGMIHAAYLLDSATHFQRFTHHFVRNEPLPHYEEVDLVCSEDVRKNMYSRPRDIVDHMYSEVDSWCREIAADLATQHEDCTVSKRNPYCRYSREAATKYLVQFAEGNLWPSSQRWYDRALPSVLRRIDEFDMPVRNPPMSSCERAVIGRLDRFVKHRKDNIAKLRLGSCLDCIKSKASQYLNAVCRTITIP